MMCAWKVNRSTMAATRRGSRKIEPHSLNGRLRPVAMEAFSSRSVTIWNSGSAPRGSSYVAELVETEKVEAAVAGDDATEPPLVGGLDQLVDELCRRPPVND